MYNLTWASKGFWNYEIQSGKGLVFLHSHLDQTVLYGDLAFSSQYILYTTSTDQYSASSFVGTKKWYGVYSMFTSAKVSYCKIVLSIDKYHDLPNRYLSYVDE